MSRPVQDRPRSPLRLPRGVAGALYLNPGASQNDPDMDDRLTWKGAEEQNL
jgi:hypothetical protein